MIASESGNELVVQHLLSRRANVNAVTQVGNNSLSVLFLNS